LSCGGRWHHLFTFSFIHTLSLCVNDATRVRSIPKQSMVHVMKFFFAFSSVILFSSKNEQNSQFYAVVATTRRFDLQARVRRGTCQLSHLPSARTYSLWIHPIIDRWDIGPHGRPVRHPAHHIRISPMTLSIDVYIVDVKNFSMKEL